MSYRPIGMPSIRPVRLPRSSSSVIVPNRLANGQVASTSPPHRVRVSVGKRPEAVLARWTASDQG